MALGGIVGGWSPNAPSDSSNIGLGASDIRSLKTMIQQPLDSEHIFDSAGTAGMGAHRDGSARAFWGTASKVSSSDTDGRLFVTSDTSRLYTVPSSQVSFLLGGRFVPHVASVFNNVGSNLTSQVTQFWSQEGGRAQMLGSSGATAVTLKNTYLTGGHVHVTQDATASLPSSQTIFYLGQVTGATLNIQAYALSGGALISGGDRVVSYWVAGRVAL